jgi:hypothetical protein
MDTDFLNRAPRSTDFAARGSDAAQDGAHGTPVETSPGTVDDRVAWIIDSDATPGNLLPTLARLLLTLAAKDCPGCEPATMYPRPAGGEEFKDEGPRLCGEPE